MMTMKRPPRIARKFTIHSRIALTTTAPGQTITRRPALLSPMPCVRKVGPTRIFKQGGLPLQETAHQTPRLPFPLTRPSLRSALKVGKRRHARRQHRVRFVGRVVIKIHNVTVRGFRSARHKRFAGACCDIGAQRTVIGLPQARAYCRENQHKFQPRPSEYAFLFGDGLFMSLGTIEIRIPTPDGSFFAFDADIVKADVPLLLGIDVLDRESIVADNVDNVLDNRKRGWKMPITRQDQHMYVKWNLSHPLYSRSQLKKMHMHYFHPSAQKLFNLLKRIDPAQTDGETFKVLQHISDSCRTCKIHSPGPHRFRVSLPKDKCIFNHELALDLMWLDGSPLLHVVDTHTHFSSARFIDGKSTKDVWHAFLMCWASIYPGYPDTFRVDQESVFKSREWLQLSEDAGIDVQLSGIESHNAIGVGERYHAPLRRIYNKIREDVPDIVPTLALQLTVKAMNDTTGPEGLVPSLLVFGILPRFPPTSTRLLSHVDRMEAMELARLEMHSITAKLKIQKALRSKIPPASTYQVNVGDDVYVYKEKDKKWRGPFQVIRIFDKQVFVNRDGKEAQYSITHVLPVEKANGLTLVYHVRRSLGKTASRQPPQVFLTEVLKPWDPRTNHTSFDPAKQKEILGLIDKGTYEVVFREEVPDNANILGGRFVLAIKNKDTAQELFKARFVVQGHLDKEKSVMVHNSTNLRQSSIRTITALAAIFGFRVWSQGVSQAYLQSADKLLREVYVKPTKEFRLAPNQLLKLLKPLYGLTDAGDYWDLTMVRHLKEDIGMSQTNLDISLFFKLIRGQLSGLSGTYVDDGIHTGDDAFLKDCDKTQAKFQSREREFNNFTFAGIQVETTSKGIRLHQERYALAIKTLPAEASFRDFRSSRQKLQWLVHTRPDIACGVNKATQVTEAKFAARHIEQLNKIISHVHKHPARGLLQQKLDMATLHLRMYADSSFADNEDLSTQLGYIVLICDASNKCNVLHFSSHKSRRVVRSVMGGEAYAMANGMDFTLTLRHDLESMLGNSLAVKMFTDSHCLFDVITKNTITTEKRLMIDIKSVREAYERMEVSDVAWIESKANPADPLTKLTSSPVLDKILDDGIIEHDVGQWVIRTPSQSDTTFTSQSGGIVDEKEDSNRGIP